MSDKKMTPEIIATLSKYEDRFRRALEGKRVELSSAGIKELEDAHFKLFGTRQSMTQCCGGSRSTSDRITPIARAYFAQINGSAKKTTGLAEAMEEAAATKAEVAQDLIESSMPESMASTNKRAVKQPKNE